MGMFHSFRLIRVNGIILVDDGGIARNVETLNRSDGVEHSFPLATLTPVEVTEENR